MAAKMTDQLGGIWTDDAELPPTSVFGPTAEDRDAFGQQFKECLPRFSPRKKRPVLGLAESAFQETEEWSRRSGSEDAIIVVSLQSQDGAVDDLVVGASEQGTRSDE